MRYTVFKDLYRAMQKAVQKEHSTRKYGGRHTKSLLDYASLDKVRQMYTENVLRSADATSIAIQSTYKRWEGLNRPTIFIRDEHTFNIINKARFDVTRLELKVPEGTQGVFSIAIPESCGVPRFIAELTSRTKLYQNLRELYLSVPDGETLFQETEKEWGSVPAEYRKGIATRIVMECPSKQNKAIPVLGFHSLGNYEGDLAGALEQMERGVENMNAQGGSEDGVMDGTQVCSSVRITWNTLAFMQAFPGCVTVGFPDKAAKEQTPHRKTSKVSHITLPDELKGSPSAHIRGAHFRTLRDERFKRSPDGTPRVVLVKSCAVGGIGNARTVSASPR